MVTTPEGKVKAQIKKVLDSFDRHVYTFMPVQTGYGATTIDYLCCIDGLFIGIEAKAPGKKPTSRQDGVMEDIRRAGGSTFVVDDDESLEVLEQFLHSVAHTWRNA